MIIYFINMYFFLYKRQRRHIFSLQRVVMSHNWTGYR